MSFANIVESTAVWGAHGTALDWTIFACQIYYSFYQVISPLDAHTCVVLLNLNRISKMFTHFRQHMIVCLIVILPFIFSKMLAIPWIAKTLTVDMNMNPSPASGSATWRLCYCTFPLLLLLCSFSSLVHAVLPWNEWAASPPSSRCFVFLVGNSTSNQRRSSR